MNLETELLEYGAASDSVRSLEQPSSPDLLDYLDLVKPREPRLRVWPQSVVENQLRPLLFVVDERNPALAEEERQSEYSKLRRLLACRGERTYLARLLPGQLKVVPVALESMPAWKTYFSRTGEAMTLIPRLALGEYDGPGEPKEPDFIFAEIFDLLTKVADQLVERVSKPDALSLIGRALFFRFLIDRRVVTEDSVPLISPKSNSLLSCFDTEESTSATFRWLDRTFNGDFLPLSAHNGQSFFEKVGVRAKDTVFRQISTILRREMPVGAHDYQLQFDWPDFNFAHVPVGLLSQVYEAFCWKWDPEVSSETSVHYTPRNIASTLVNEVFEALPNAHSARVLDPACGAGIFLVLALRRLYRERWEVEGKQPNTKAIREIMETQLVGFDTSDFALRLAALSLYLTAIELDPHPVPPEKLRFKELRNNVLFNFRVPEDNSNAGFRIGSLGPDVDPAFDNSFSLVLSNPPWTSLPEKKKDIAMELAVTTRAIIGRRAGQEIADRYENPDNSPDLPFLWRSTEWCKKGGRIAMALPARILLKQADVPRRAREILFRLLEVTGIINGANLSDSAVWPEMSQPFMLMFAKNQPPKRDSVVRLITPYYDAHLNGRGEARIDSKSSEQIEVQATFDEPWLWKTFAVGTSLDAEIVRKLKAASATSLGEYWPKVATGQGYRVAERSKQFSAELLKNLPNLDSTDRFPFIVEADKLDPFKRETLNRPRTKTKIYEPPLLLVKVSPGDDRSSGRALLCLEKIAYNESFYGYSAAWHPEGEFLVRYTHLLAHSNIQLYYALMASAEFGAERRKIQKVDLDECPFVPLEALTEQQRQLVASLSDRLVSGDATVFAEIDLFVGRLYGLGGLDMEVINDTLEVCLPYKKSRERACARPTVTEQDRLRSRVESLLRPFFEVIGKEPRVNLWEPPDDDVALYSPFGVLLISSAERTEPSPNHAFRDSVLPLANETAVTQVIQEIEEGLVVGILNQYRYWTASRARLLAAEILSEHAGFFEA